MRKLIASATAAVFIATAPIAWGQAPIEKEAAPQSTKINLTLEQRHVIKELLKDSGIVSASADLHLAVGGKLPESINAYPVPADVGAKVSQIKSHLVLLQGGQIFIIDPKDKTVVDVIE